MESQADIINEKMASLSDEELLRVLTTEAENYSPEGLNAAQREAEKRGGFGPLLDRAGELAREKVEAQRERIQEQTEISRIYPFWQHVLTVAKRWYMKYGVLAIMWVIYKTGILGNNDSVLSGVNLLFGLLVCTLLFALQMMIWAAVTYRKEVRESGLLVCEHCGKPLIVNIRLLCEDSAMTSAGQLPCPSCGQPTGAKLEELIRKAGLESD